MDMPDLLDEGEIWKPAVGFPHYMVSNYGRVWSPKRKGHCGGIKSQCIRTRKNGKTVCVTVMLAPHPGKIKSVRVHRLVLEAFVGPRPDGYHSCHFDGNPENNNLSNLRWDTAKANHADSRRHGTASKPPVFYGERNFNATLTDAQIAEIRATLPSPGYKAAMAKKYKVSKTSISRYIKGKSRVAGTVIHFGNKASVS